MELVDTSDLKSAGPYDRAGSNPAPGTNLMSKQIDYYRKRI